MVERLAHNVNTKVRFFSSLFFFCSVGEEVNAVDLKSTIHWFKSNTE